MPPAAPPAPPQPPAGAPDPVGQFNAARPAPAPAPQPWESRGNIWDTMRGGAPAAPSAPPQPSPAGGPSPAAGAPPGTNPTISSIASEQSPGFFGGFDPPAQDAPPGGGSFFGDQGPADVTVNTGGGAGGQQNGGEQGGGGGFGGPNSGTDPDPLRNPASDIPEWILNNPDLFYGMDPAELQRYFDLFGGQLPSEPPIDPATGGFRGYGDPTEHRGNVVAAQTDPRWQGDPLHLAGTPDATYLGISALEGLAREQLGKGQEAQALMGDLRDDLAQTPALLGAEGMARDLAADPYSTSSPELRADLERRGLEDIEGQRQMTSQRLRDTGATAGPAGTEAQLGAERDFNRARTDYQLQLDDEFARRRGEDISRSSRAFGDLGELTTQFRTRPEASYADLLRQPYEPYRASLADVYLQLGGEQSSKSLALRNAPAIDYIAPIVGGIAGGAGSAVGREIGRAINN